MRIAVILPSRGLMFSQTAEELLEILDGYDYEIYWSHGNPIPECFNLPTEKALNNSQNTHFFYIEDDMVIPKNTLKRLLAAKQEAITCDYPVSYAGKPSVFRDPDNNAIYGGTGCLLVTRKFLEAYKQPIFRTDIAWDVKLGDRFEATPRKIKGDLYGLHDVTFGLLAYNRGTPIKIAKFHCGQRKLKALGQPGTNNGEHVIQVWTNFMPESMAAKELTSRNVELTDGTIALMDLKRAKELEKQGKVTIPPNKYIELIENDVLKELI